MGSKQTANNGREAHEKENWKRKRGENNTAKDGPSQTRPFKKPKNAHQDPAQSTSGISSQADDSGFPTTTHLVDFSLPSGEVATTHDITSINIISSTHIQKKVTQTLELLSEYPAIPPAKPKVVLLHSKAPVASKLITITEIAKREVAKSGGKWFQYNKVEEVMVEPKETPKKDTGENLGEKKASLDNEEEDEETTAFETMKTPFERSIVGKAKVRAVPVMTIYLSRIRVDSLRKAYGEQTNAMEGPKS